MTPSAVELLARWDACWWSLGAPAVDPREGRALLARWAEPHRHYHTLQHLAECLARFDRVRDRAEAPAACELALWYHDAVYEPQRADNEARSAELAEAAIGRAFGRLPGAAGLAATVRGLVLATQHAAAPAPGDAALVVDADLGVLAAEPSRFDEYERQVRQEYAWVPGLLYRAKRRAVLQGFLDRERIFTSGAFDADEARARENLVRSLARL